jgi:hypothetical protein
VPHSGSPAIQSLPSGSRRLVRVTSPTHPAFPQRRSQFLGLKEERRTLCSQRYSRTLLHDSCSRRRDRLPRIRFPMAFLFLDDRVRPLDSTTDAPSGDKCLRFQPKSCRRAAGAATVDSAALYRQVHFFEEFGVSRVVMQISKQRIAVDLKQSGVSLFVGKLQPSERFLGLPAIRIPLSYLIGLLIWC